MSLLNGCYKITKTKKKQQQQQQQQQQQALAHNLQHMHDPKFAQPFYCANLWRRLQMAQPIRQNQNLYLLYFECSYGVVAEEFCVQ